MDKNNLKRLEGYIRKFTALYSENLGESEGVRERGREEGIVEGREGDFPVHHLILCMCLHTYFHIYVYIHIHTFIHIYCLFEM